MSVSRPAVKLPRKATTDAHMRTDRYCFGCYRRQPRGRCYLTCGECGHRYRTRWHLFLLWRWGFTKVWWLDWYHAPRQGGKHTFRMMLPLPDWAADWVQVQLDEPFVSLEAPSLCLRWYHILARPWLPSQISMCPCCIHDL